MIKMTPDWISPDVQSNAEKKLFNGFKNTRTANTYFILHSLGVSDHIDKIFGEIDFVIICSEGVLCVEVKGGRISRNDGTWFFENRFGHKDKSNEGPFKQVQGNMQSLRHYLLKNMHLEPDSPLVNCQYASCVIMPDCHFTERDIEIIPDILFDKESYNGLEQVVTQSFKYWRNQMMIKHHHICGTLNEKQIDQLVRLLRGNFSFVPSLKEMTDQSYESLCQLTKEQYIGLIQLENNNRVLVSGVAGSGKTLIAMERARRLHDEGKDVLYICYNRNISEFVKARFIVEGLDIPVATLHGIMSDGKYMDNRDKNYFENILPAEFLEKSYVKKYDWIIVDEGQDLFRQQYLDCLGKLVKGGLSQGNWDIFFDPNQNIYNTDDQASSAFDYLKQCNAFVYTLVINCRNTKDIAQNNTFISGITQTGLPQIDGPNVQYFSYISKDEEYTKLIDLLLTLRNEGFHGNEIVILSRYAISNDSNCLNGRQFEISIGTLKLDGQMWHAQNKEIRFSTISAFKGLESKVVILIDVDGFEKEEERLLNYVAVSRAESLLFVFYDINRDAERQKMIALPYL